MLCDTSQNTRSLFTEHRACVSAILEDLMAGSVIHPLNLACWATDQIIHTHQLPEVTPPPLETHLPPALSQKRLFLLLFEKTINIHHRLMNEEKYRRFHHPVLSNDIFTMSGLRHLLFHAEEHSYTLAEINSIIR